MVMRGVMMMLLYTVQQSLYTRTLRHSQTHPSLSPSPGHSQRLCYKMTHDILLNYCYRHPACSTSHYIGFTDLRVLYTLHRIRVCNFRGQFRMIPDIICQSVPGYMTTIWIFTFSFCSGLQKKDDDDTQYLEDTPLSHQTYTCIQHKS